MQSLLYNKQKKNTGRAGQAGQAGQKRRKVQRTDFRRTLCLLHESLHLGYRLFAHGVNCEGAAVKTFDEKLHSDDCKIVAERRGGGGGRIDKFKFVSIQPTAQSTLMLPTVPLHNYNANIQYTTWHQHGKQ